MIRGDGIVSIVKYWILCATDAKAKYIKQNDDGCLAIFAEERLGRNIENMTPNVKLHEVDYVKLNDHKDRLLQLQDENAKLKEELEAKNHAIEIEWLESAELEDIEQNEIEILKAENAKLKEALELQAECLKYIGEDINKIKADAIRVARQCTQGFRRV